MTARQPQLRTGSSSPARRALGRAPDVARAVESVAAEDEHGQESHGSHRTCGAAVSGDVTTTNVDTADETTSSKEVVRILTGQKVNALPVMTKEDHVAGTVSEADVLVRPDKEIAAEVHGVLTGVLFAKPHGAKVTVSDGMVTLSGALPRADLIPIAERLASEVDGVVTVTCKLTGPSRRPESERGRGRGSRK